MSAALNPPLQHKMGFSWVAGNLFITKDGAGMFDGAEQGRLQKGVAKQLKLEIKEADTENRKIASSRQLECSLRAVLPRKREIQGLIFGS